MNNNTNIIPFGEMPEAINEESIAVMNRNYPGYPLYRYDETEGVLSIRQGDYPDFYYVACAEESLPMGKYLPWGQRHLNYLKQSCPEVLAELIATGQLHPTLTDLNTQAKAMFSQLVKDIAEKAGITETLKASDPLSWVGQMNAVKSQATEIINHELIYR